MGAKLQPQDQLHIANCTSFCAEVDELVKNSSTKADEREATTGQRALRLGYIEAVLEVATRRGIEPDLAAAYLNPEIKEALRMEFVNRHMMQQTATLPF